MSETFDVVIAGSGAGGSPVALTLARAGVRVLVLEKGRQLPADEQFHDEVAQSLNPFFVPDVAEDPHTIRTSDAQEAQPTSEGWTCTMVGGGTVHYGAYFFRMKPAEFRIRTLLGNVPGASLADWPISYSDLEPHYRTADEMLGVSGAWHRHPFEEPRSADYPLPPLDEHPFAARIDELSSRMGMHPFPTPRAILSRPQNGRGACAYCTRCAASACPTGAKGATSVAFLPAAIQTGRCELRPQCTVTEVTLRPDGRARGVVYRDAAGTSHEVEARCVVLACTAIETARLMLLSASKRFPNGIANGAGLVGKNLVFVGNGGGLGTFHTGGRADRAWLRPAGKHPPSPFVNRAFQDLYELGTPQDGVKLGGTIHFLLSHGNPITAAMRMRMFSQQQLWGAPLREQLRRELRDCVNLEFETFYQWLPNPMSRVDLDPHVRDRWGVPAARITVVRHPLTDKTAAVLRSGAESILRALEPDSVVIGDPSQSTFLQGGTCRFGTDPAASVLDATCRTHEVDNLYVTDGSFLPSGGGAPMTATIMANAFRVAGIIAKRLQARAL